MSIQASKTTAAMQAEIPPPEMAVREEWEEDSLSGWEEDSAPLEEWEEECLLVAEWEEACRGVEWEEWECLVDRGNGEKNVVGRW